MFDSLEVIAKRNCWVEKKKKKIFLGIFALL